MSCSFSKVDGNGHGGLVGWFCPEAGEEEYGREHERAVCRSQGMGVAEIDATFAEIDAAPKRSWEDIPY